MFTIRPIFKILLLALPALAGLMSAFRILWQSQPLQMKEGIHRCIKKIPVVLAASVFMGILCMLYLRSGMPYSDSFKMGFTYPKASKGLTPNSTTMDVSEIFSSDVLEKVVQTGEFGEVSADDIKDTLSIDHVKQRDGVSTDDLYVSTEYVVSYIASDRTASLDKDILLKAVADSYYEYFTSRYGRKTDVLKGDYSEVSELDYLDVDKYLKSRINAVIEYMQMCSNENSTFVSDVTKESFGSVMDKAKNFLNVSLERYEAYVLKYGLSKNHEQYISRLNYENRIENVEYMKNLAAYNVRISAIERYDGDITRAVLVPSRDTGGEFYQSRTKIGTDYFAAQANDRLNFAANNQLNIETNNYHIQSLSAAAGGDTQKKRADEMVEDLKQEIIDISNQAIQTVEDYDTQTSNGYISFAFQDETTFMRSCIKKAVLYTAAVFVVLSAAVFAGVEFTGRKKQKAFGEKQNV